MTPRTETPGRVPGALLLTVLLALAGCGREEQHAPAAEALRQPGHWLLVNYWAEWCKPCLEEIPELGAFAARHAGTARVVMVNFDGVTGEALQQQARTLGIPPELVLDRDPAGELGLARPEALPSTFVIDPSGAQRNVLLGPQTVASLEAAIGSP
jgi:thiol-disulfide isomerase/thioredoxin